MCMLAFCLQSTAPKNQISKRSSEYLELCFETTLLQLAIIGNKVRYYSCTFHFVGYYKNVLNVTKFVFIRLQLLLCPLFISHYRKTEDGRR